MPAMKYSWINKHHFALYSKVAVGGTLASSKSTENGKSENNSKLYFMGQVSAIGVEFGSKLLASLKSVAVSRVLFLVV